MEVILVKAQSCNGERIDRFHALRCFTEKIDIVIPYDQYIAIGLNA